MQSVRNFFWKVTDTRAIQTLDLFIKLAVHRGLHHNDVLEEALERYNAAYLEDNPAVKPSNLVSESDLLDMLREAGLTVSHTLLMKYKREGKFSQSLTATGPLFYSNGTKVVYDWPLCRAWFTEKLAS